MALSDKLLRLSIKDEDLIKTSLREESIRNYKKSDWEIDDVSLDWESDIPDEMLNNYFKYHGINDACLLGFEDLDFILKRYSEKSRS